MHSSSFERFLDHRIAFIDVCPENQSAPPKLWAEMVKKLIHKSCQQFWCRYKQVKVFLMQRLKYLFLKSESPFSQDEGYSHITKCHNPICYLFVVACHNIDAVWCDSLVVMGFAKLLSFVSLGFLLLIIYFICLSI